MKTKPKKQADQKRSSACLTANDGSIIPVSNVFPASSDLPALHKNIATADVIILHDCKNPDHNTCVYGHAILSYIVKNEASMRLAICHATIDFDAKYRDLEVILAMIKMEKGHEEYREYQPSSGQQQLAT